MLKSVWADCLFLPSFIEDEAKHVETIAHFHKAGGVLLHNDITDHKDLLIDILSFLLIKTAQ